MNQSDYGLQNYAGLQNAYGHGRVPSPEDQLRERISMLDSQLQTNTVEDLQRKRREWTEQIERARSALAALTGECL